MLDVVKCDRDRLRDILGIKIYDIKINKLWELVEDKCENVTLKSA